MWDTIAIGSGIAGLTARVFMHQIGPLRFIHGREQL